MLVDQLPFVPPLLETVGLTDKQGFLIAGFQHNVHLLHCADDPHVAVQKNERLENLNFEGFEIAEDLVKEFSGWLNSSRRKGRDVEPKHVFRPVLCALLRRHGFGHFLHDGDDRLLVLVGILFVGQHGLSSFPGLLLLGAYDFFTVALRSGLVSRRLMMEICPFSL